MTRYYNSDHMYDDIPYYDMDEPLTFGKHEDRTPEWIMKNDNSYFIWLYENNVIYCDEF